jgi:hypothetical protein
MLTLLDVPNRVDPEAELGGAPHAADAANIDHTRDVFGRPTFVRWPARDDRGERVLVLIGFETINSIRITANLKQYRAAIQAAASATHMSDASEVVLLAA